MNFSSLLGSLYIVKEDIAMLKKDLMWEAHYFLIKILFDFPKIVAESLVTFVV